MCIYLPATGTYAVAVYHDTLANRRLDRSKIGVPAEGFGFSNNSRVFLGMPGWNSVRLPVWNGDMHTGFKLRYP